MKTIASLSSLLLATSASAHTAAAPHVHNGAETNWTPTIATIAVVAFATYLLIRRAKDHRAAKAAPRKTR